MQMRYSRLRRRNRGETLVETLAAILIISLSSAFLLTASMAASRINQSARTSDEQLRKEQTAAEEQTVHHLGTVTVQTDGSTYAYRVNQTGDDAELRTYTVSEQELKP